MLSKDGADGILEVGSTVTGQKERSICGRMRMKSKEEEEEKEEE